ncbi:hypothetical protein NLU13_1688 [Sarocladium strictum]|uniref:Uncharacterized protein n=1 Tax=Sarocladium strictum TaxID=5046 RepID=A0AA39GRF4_SARSR|nr:hypothetical protein NLU13_1688 [Sarocladium strictum]
MLAAHRDQENLVHSHQVPTKQNPKTPGARYPKTPSRFNDENAPTGFAAKTGGKSILKGAPGRQAIMTPMGNANRAVLGDKTTNAKARAGQTGGVKGLVKELEKTTIKPTTVQRPQQRGPEVAPIKFDIKQDKEGSQDEEEPEYAPPPVEPQPYESDVLPRGLTFEGLKDENLLRGFYDYYHNPVDANGVSRKDKQLEDEIETLVARAAERNVRDLQDLDWTTQKDENVPAPPKMTKPSAPNPTAASRVVRRGPGTITSRRAAASLSQPSEPKGRPTIKPTTIKPAVRRPLSSLIQGKRTIKRPIPVARDPPTAQPGAMASRTTLGYNKGRTASSVLHPQRKVTLTASKPPSDGSLEETITPARARMAMRQAATPASPPRPGFLSIFEGLDDDEDLPVQTVPQHLLEEDEEEFELRLEI